MNAFHKRLTQAALNAVYRTTALVLRELGCTESEAVRACERLASQAPEKFSRDVFLEVFNGGPEVAEQYRIKDRESLERSRQNATRPYRVNHLRKIL